MATYSTTFAHIGRAKRAAAAARKASALPQLSTDDTSRTALLAEEIGQRAFDVLDRENGLPDGAPAAIAEAVERLIREKLAHYWAV